MSRAKPVSKAGRRRVERALDEFGLLLVQGQWEIPSLADLIEGSPITTKGFSWDYVPAWDLCDELAAQDHISMIKLFRGRNTIVEKRHWPAVHALAKNAVSVIAKGVRSDDHAAFLDLIARNPGISGERIKEDMGLSDKAGRRRFQKIKQDLEALCCIVPEERKDVASHTHDAAWFAWEEAKIARNVAGGGADLPTVSEASQHLLAVATEYVDGVTKTKPSTLYPLIGLTATR